MRTRRSFIQAAGVALLGLRATGQSLSGSASISGRAAMQSLPPDEHVLLPTDLNDNAFNGSPITVNGVTYYFSSTMARAVFTTDATLIGVDGYSTITGENATASRVGARVAGVDVATIAPTANGPFSKSFTLPAGSKTVEVITGSQNLTGTVLGVFLRAILLPAGSSFTLVQQTVAPRILVYGDSIAAGYAATTPPLQAWEQLIRESYATSVMIEAWGSRSLSDDAANGTLRAAFVAHIAAQGPATLWLAIGSNDWSMTKWTAANFGVAYASLLDDLHTALPSTAIYCQSPIVRSGTTNGNGETLANFRSQISTAAAARPLFCTYVDGTAILSAGDLADGTHPTTAGHVLYANYVKTVLGIS